MGATNHTTNYNLPQFVGSDKPTWLGDVNGAMSSIDTQMKANSDLATTATNTADTASTTASTALANASIADDKAVTAQTTANSALSKALDNEAKINLFDLVEFDTYSGSQMTTNNGLVQSYSSVTIAKNADVSICKIYGTIWVNGNNTGEAKVTISNTGIEPDTDITVNCVGLVLYSNQITGVDVTFKTNGDVVINGYTDTIGSNKRITLSPVLIFIKNFGDTPQNN